MADRYCNNCGHALSRDDRFCPNCGRPTAPDVQAPPPPQPPPQQSQPGLSRVSFGCINLFFYAIAILIGLLVLAFVVGALG